MKTVLITGANGFVGHHLAKELSQNGLDVVGVGGKQLKTGRPASLSDYLELDLMDPEAAKSIDFSPIDGVIHLAAMSAAGQSYDEPLKFINTNIGLEINLYEAALKQNQKPKFLIVSSGLLYDPDAPLPLDENSPIEPISPYAVSKIGQEQMAHYYHIRGFHSVIARPFNHIGPGQGLGFLVPDLAQQIVAFKKGGAKEIQVGNLDAKRDYTDVRDIVRAYRLMLEKGESGQTYNICSGQAHSGHDILNGLAQAAGVMPETKEDPSKIRPSDYPVIYGNHDKLSRATGWQPEISLETTLADVIADWENR